MPIRFKCHHCKKPLRVKDELAGRKSICPACRKPIVIPRPKPSAAQVEDLAASMLGDGEEKKEVKPKVEAKPIEFNCEFCDEKVTVALTEAGTKLPCPECRRIIRVPVPNEDKPKDWRDVARKGPMGAKDNQPQELDNAWGTEQTKRVTGKALEEAGAVVVKVKSRGPGIWVQRGFWGTITLGFLYMAYAGMVNSRNESQEKVAIGQALKLVPKLNAEWAAEIHRAAGELYCSKLKPVEARKQFHTALASLNRSQTPGSIEADLFLIDLALAQIEMGGSPDEVMSKERLPWSDVERDVGQTMLLISVDARGLALCLVGTRLAEKKQTLLAISMAGGSPAQQEGLTLAYKAELEKAVQDPDKEAAKIAKKALENLSKQTEKPAPKADDQLIDPEARQAHVEGLARQRKYKEALELACDRRAKNPEETKQETKQCLKACVGGAELALANKNPSEASPFVDKAVDTIKELQQQTAVPPWLMFETIRAGIEANVAGVQELIPLLDPAFQPYVNYLNFRQKLSKATAAVPTVEGVGVEKQQRESLSWPLAWEALARHNARSRTRDNVLALLETAQDERVRAFLLVGFALGHHPGPK